MNIKSKMPEYARHSWRIYNTTEDTLSRYSAMDHDVCDTGITNEIKKSRYGGGAGFRTGFRAEGINYLYIHLYSCNTA